ncbi:hypothetical protein [Magnetovibrio blakemorei]|nr:hypothetical protein [Magnetovibrio blakemorei]
MFGMNKKAEVETDGPLAGEAEDVPQSPLFGARVVDGEVVFEGGEAANENDEPQGRITTDDVKRFYTEDKFHNHVVKTCAWIGRKRGYKSLQIDAGDEEFRASVEVVYRRLADSAIAPLLERLGSQALEDAIILFIGFGPVVKGVLNEKMEKRKARVSATVAETSSEGDEHVGN